MPAQNQRLGNTSFGGLPHWVRVATIGRNWKFTLVRLAVLVVACFLVFRFILLPVRIEGISMEPTFRDGSVDLVNRLAYLWHAPRRGDVVGIRLANPSVIHPSVMYLKRIVGLPGETVSFVHGQVLVGGRPLAEPYEKYNCDWNLPAVVLGPHQYFVVGDNRSMAPQDHVFGKADRDQIVGKAL